MTVAKGKGGKKGARKAVKAQATGPVGRKAVAAAESRAASAKTPTAKRVTRQLADRLRDVHSGKAAKRIAGRSPKPVTGRTTRGGRKTR